MYNHEHENCSCGCGHDHDHHEHEHVHSYTHSHAHDHEHCGDLTHEHCHGTHDHEHCADHGHAHHVHDEHCDCGHDHGHAHHEHEGCGADCHESGCNCSDCAGAVKTGFRLTRVEGATAAAVRFQLAGPQGRAEVEMATRIKALAADISAVGGIVGHIKAGMTGEAEVTTFSCTGGSVTIGRKTEPGVCQVDLVAIILGLSDEAIEAAVRNRFPEI